MTEGAISTAAATITKIGSADQPLVSINDVGQVAYIGQVGDTEGLFVSQPNGDIVDLTPGFRLEKRTFGPGLQINNRGSVVAVDRSTNASEVGYCLRQWNVAQPNQATPLVSGGNCGVLQGVHKALFGWPSISNTGDIVYTGLDIVGTHEQLGVVAPITPFSFALQSKIHPVVADTGIAAVYLEKPNVKIILVETRPQLKIRETVAAVGTDFSALGQPGISDDGRVSVFYGNLTETGANRYNQLQANRKYADGKPLLLAPLSPGPGIFAMVQTDVNLILVRIAGKAGNGYLDPGETYSDSNKNKKFDPGEEDFGIIGNFDAISRPSVSNFDRNLLTATVVFRAIGKNSMVGIYSSVLAFNLTPGLFPGLQINPNRPPALGSFATTLVTEKTKKINGISGSVQDVQIYDSINNKGDIAFWVKMDTGEQSGVRAE